MSAPLSGRKVFAVTASAFGVIIAVNVLLAVQAVRTFPGLETGNSYVASQRFDAERAAQEALGWTVDASVEDGRLSLRIEGRDGRPAAVTELDATIGRATHVADDTVPALLFDGQAWGADVALAPGLWHLRLTARAADGTAFRQRVPLRVRAAI